MDRDKGVAVIGALWVAADAEPAAGPVELETVTVTATKTEHPAFEVAGSVSMVAAETIEAEQPQSLNDILKALPNIELFSGPRRLGEEANIRGFSDERIVTTLDGARQNFSIGHQGRFVLEPDLLKQVEVYRGANSALYGSGALGGVIALTTKDPSDFLEAEEVLGARLKGGFQSVNDEWLGSTPPTGASFHPSSLRAHHLAVLAIQGLRVRELADRLHGGPGTPLSRHSEDPRHQPHLHVTMRWGHQSIS
jgi:outer membrane receptor protein involved in Fe transport